MEPVFFAHRKEDDLQLEVKKNGDTWNHAESWKIDRGAAWELEEERLG